MTTLWITSFPLGKHLRAAGIVAVRDAMRILNADPSISGEQAYETLVSGPLPVCVGATDDQDAHTAASGLLSAQSFGVRADLSPEQVSELRTAQIEPADPEAVVEDYDLSVAKVALVLMQQADGMAGDALGAAAAMANALGETADDPGLMYDVGVLLAEAFNPGAQVATMTRMADLGGHS